MIIAGILYDQDTRTGYVIESGTPEWVDLLDWLCFHELNPDLIVRGSTIIRDTVNRRITYRAFQTDSAGLILCDDTDALTETRVEQGEAPPLPVPDSITYRCRMIYCDSPPAASTNGVPSTP